MEMVESNKMHKEGKKSTVMRHANQRNGDGEEHTNRGEGG